MRQSNRAIRMNRCILILAALVSLWCFASAEQPATGPSSQPAVESKPVEKDGVAVSVILKPGIISADEQPKIVVRFKNTTADYINLYDVEAFWDWQIQFTSTDEHAAHPGPWKLRMDKILLRYPVAHKQMKAGECVEVVADLNDPPFTFDFVYAGAANKTVPPLRNLSPGTYRMTIAVGLQNPFGAGRHEWVGPVTTDAVELVVCKPDAAETKPTTQEVSAYDDAINRVTEKLRPNGEWTNGITPGIQLAADAKAGDVIASAVNVQSQECKAYRILRVRRLDRPQGDLSAALLRMGTKTRVLVFFPIGKSGWWTRFYDADPAPPATSRKSAD
jgi:hypothetical protein